MGAPQVSALEALRQALFTDILELKRERERALVARTLLGHMQNMLGDILSVYCIYRCARATPHHAWPATGLC